MEKQFRIVIWEHDKESGAMQIVDLYEFMESKADYRELAAENLMALRANALDGLTYTLEEKEIKESS